MHRCSLDILRSVSAAAAKLSSWRCGNILIKASWHLKDKSKNKKLSKAQKSKPSIAWRLQEKLEKMKKFGQTKKEGTKKLDLAVLFIFMIKDNLGKIYL